MKSMISKYGPNDIQITHFDNLTELHQELLNSAQYYIDEGDDDNEELLSLIMSKNIDGIISYFYEHYHVHITVI